jgi:dUTP pyrophosphatase
LSYRGDYQYRFRAIPVDFIPSYDNGVIGYGYYGTPSKMIYSKFPYNVGDRIGQIYLEEVIDIDWEIVDELSESDRGEGGFGSSGK